jgi:hypothetical protein
MEGPEPCLCLPDVRTNAKFSLEQTGIRKRAGYITCTQNSPQTHENAQGSPGETRASDDKQPPGDMPRKTANAFLVWPLVVKIFFVVHVLNLTFRYQSVLDADVLFPRLVNSLTAIDGHDHQYFNELRSTVVSRRIFIRSQSLTAH